MAVIEAHVTERSATGIAAGGSTHLGRRAGLIGSIFGCWHRNLSRPLTRNGETYRACLKCGARRQFSLGTWELNGPYYYGSSSSQDLVHVQIKTVQPKNQPRLVKRVA